MSAIALFPSVLGVRPGILDAAERLRAGGHEVHIVDQYEGRAFNDYAQANRYAQGIGYPALMRGAFDAVAGLPDPVCRPAMSGAWLADEQDPRDAVGAAPDPAANTWSHPGNEARSRLARRRYKAGW